MQSRINLESRSGFWHDTTGLSITYIHYFYLNMQFGSKRSSHFRGNLTFPTSDTESDQFRVQFRILTWYMTLHCLYPFWIDKYPFVLLEYGFFWTFALWLGTIMGQNCRFWIFKKKSGNWDLDRRFSQKRLQGFCCNAEYRWSRWLSFIWKYFRDLEKSSCYGSFSDDSRSQFWVHWIISESTWPFLTKLHIQVKLMHIYQFRMDISSGESYVMLESWSGLGIDQTPHPSFGKVGLSRKWLDRFEPNCIFK